ARTRDSIGASAASQVPEILVRSSSFALMSRCLDVKVSVALARRVMAMTIPRDIDSRDGKRDTWRAVAAVPILARYGPRPFSFRPDIVCERRYSWPIAVC